MSKVQEIALTGTIVSGPGRFSGSLCDCCSPDSRGPAAGWLSIETARPTPTPLLFLFLLCGDGLGAIQKAADAQEGGKDDV